MDKKFWFQIIGLIVLIILAMFLAFNYRVISPFISQLAGSSPRPVTQVSSGIQKLKIVDSAGNTKAQLDIEIADDKEERAKGLSGRESLGVDSGVLFIHESPSKYTYWMKGMKIPIDIIWISDDTIVDIIPNIPPPIEGQTDDTLERYAPTVEVNRVLETNAGYVVAKNIQKGDKIMIENSP